MSLLPLPSSGRVHIRRSGAGPPAVAAPCRPRRTSGTVSLNANPGQLPGGATLQQLTNGIGGWALILALWRWSSARRYGRSARTRRTTSSRSSAAGPCSSPVSRAAGRCRAGADQLLLPCRPERPLTRCRVARVCSIPSAKPSVAPARPSSAPAPMASSVPSRTGSSGGPAGCSTRSAACSHRRRRSTSARAGSRRTTGR